MAPIEGWVLRAKIRYWEVTLDILLLSQRYFDREPRVVGNRLPWIFHLLMIAYPKDVESEGLASPRGSNGTEPQLVVFWIWQETQGRNSAPTLG